MQIYIGHCIMHIVPKHPIIFKEINEIFKNIHEIYNNSLTYIIYNTHTYYKCVFIILFYRIFTGKTLRYIVYIYILHSVQCTVCTIHCTYSI